VHVGEAHQCVFDAVDAHELEPMDHLDAGRVAFHDERADRAGLAGFARRPRHHHVQLGDRSVGAPELLAVQHVAGAVGGGHRSGRHARRIGAHVHLGERERGDRTFGQTRQQARLLLLGAEQLERRRHADRLVSGEQRHHRAAARSDQTHRAAVAVLRQPEPAVLARNLDAEGADLLEALDHRARNPPGVLDLRGIHLVPQQPLELF
jgi:hypothetical protein